MMKTFRIKLLAVAVLLAGSGRAALAEGPLTAAPAELDLGYRAPGETVEETVWLINTGDEPVTLLGATGSCGCLAVEVGPQTIEPRAALGVLLGVTAAKEPGRAKEVTVSFQVEGGAPLRLPVRVATTGEPSEPRGDVVAEPAVIDLGVVTAGARSATSVTLLNTGSAPRTVTAARAGCSCVGFPAFEPFSIASGSEAGVQVEIEAPWRITPQTTRRITLEIEGQPPVVVPVHLETRHPRADAFREHVRKIFSESWTYGQLELEDDTLTAVVWPRDEAAPAAPAARVICRFGRDGAIESTRFEPIAIKD